MPLAPQPPYAWTYKPPLGSELDLSNALLNGLLSLWMLNEGIGTVLYDSLSYNTVPMNTVGGPTWQGGSQLGLTFNGSQRAQTNLPVSPLVGANLTNYSVWAYFRTGPTAPTGRQLLFGKSDATNSKFEYEIEASDSAATPGNFPCFLAFSAGGGTNALVYDSNQLAANTDYQLVGVFSVPYSNIYVNGRAGSNPATGSILNTLDSGTPLLLGGRDNGTNFFTGTIYATGFWNRKLTPAEVTSLYLNPYQFIQPPSARRYMVIPVPATKGTNHPPIAAYARRSNQYFGLDHLLRS